MQKIVNERKYIYTVMLIITPIIIMMSNLINMSNALIWFFPNLIMFVIGLKTILINIKKKENMLLILLLIIALIACLFAHNKYEAFLGSDYRLEGLITYIGYVGFFVTGKKLIEEQKNIRLIRLFLLTATFLSLISLLRIGITYKLLDIPKDIPYYFYQGPFNHFNHFGYYLLIASICATLMYIYSIKKTNKIIYLTLTIVLLYALVINDTFGVYLSYLAILICLIIYHINKKNKLKETFIVTIIFIIISAITYRYDFNIHIVSRNFKELFNDSKEIVEQDNIENLYEIGTSRGKLWTYSIKYISKKPLFGYGYDNIKYEYWKDDIIESRPHNLILEQSTNIGIIGMIIYFILILSIVIKKIVQIPPTQIIALSVVIGYLMSSMFGNSTFYVSPYFYVFLGILAQEVKNEKNRTTCK